MREAVRMRFPTREAISSLLEPVKFPPFARVRYAPTTPEVDDATMATRKALDAIQVDAPTGARVAVCVGSRGISDIVEITAAVVDRLISAGYRPIIVPAMGAHGGATAAGQRAVLAELGITADRLGCPIDDRIETAVIGRARVNGIEFDVHLAEAALDAAAIVPINRIKPHTTFSDRIESGVCKMTVVGLGKQAGARLIHRYGLKLGFEPVISASLPVIREAISLPGGIGIVENFHDRTAHIVGIPPDSMIDTEAELLTRAREYLPTLPFETIDLLVVDNIGKDISGTGMDTNVIGRAAPPAAAPREAPTIARIFVRGLTHGTHGNAYGVGLADVAHRSVLADLDLEATYANALTSGGLGNAALPPLMPTDRSAMLSIAQSIGGIDPAELRVAWIEHTGQLSSYRVSAPLIEADHERDLIIEEWQRLAFEDGSAVFEAMADPPE